MNYLVIFIFTICSCVIFDTLGFMGTVNSLVASYKEQFQTMKRKDLDDEAKQKALMSLISRQIKYLGKLIFGILLFIAPFGIYFILEYFFEVFNTSYLYQLSGIGISLGAVLVYILIKKQYGRL